MRQQWIAIALVCGGAGMAAAQSPLPAPGVLGEASGTGPWPAVAELHADLSTHTIYRPATMPKQAMPLFVWGNGACRDNGLAYGAFLRQVASHGYFVISVGRPRAERPFDPAPAQEPPAVAPGQPPPRQTPDETRPAQLLEAMDWAQRENARKGGPFHGRIDLARIAAGGHSCGGLQALAVSGDARVKTTLVLASGIYVNRAGGGSGVAIDKSALSKLHGPALYLTGGPRDIAHPNALDDVGRLQHVPVFHGSLPVGHGGTFWTERDGGAWARVTVRWLDWQLKRDADASWDFAGPACRLCGDARWSVTQKNLGLPSGPWRESRYVAVRDGTRLAVNVYRPARDGRPLDGKRPVLFAFTPYRARHRNAAGEVVEAEIFRRYGLGDPDVHGYVLAVADIRGKGASFGARRGFQDRTEAQDGHDLVQWLARQPWADGKVGMVGCSYLGGTTIHVASTAPPALKAVFTGATDIDKYAFVRRGGITAQFNTRPDEPLSDDLASLPVDEDVDGSLLRAAVAEHAGNTPMAALWYGMPFRDSVSSLTGNRFWEEVGPYPYIDEIRRAGIATYFWGNWQDEPTEQVLLWAANLDGKLLVGPGTHCVPPPGFDFTGELRRYFDHHLRGNDTGLYREPRVTWHLDGAPAGSAWIRSERLPGQGVERSRWFLAGENALAPRPASRGRAGFTVDYDVGSTEYFAFWIDSQHGRGLSWTSEPLASPRALVGAPVVQLRLAADREDARVFAYLEEVAPEGRASVLSFGRLQASLRRTGAAPYETLGLPWHTGLERDRQPLRPGRFEALRFGLTPVGRVVPAGARLRLVITGADPRQRDLAGLREDPPPRLEVELARDSFVELPLLPAGRQPK